MPVKIVKKGHSGSVVEEVVHKDKSTSKKETELPFEHDGDGAMAEVGIVLGRTVNLQNYESARVSVSIKMPCPPEDLDETFETIQSWADERVGQLLDEIMGSKQ
jgi:hypothetical protein